VSPLTGPAVRKKLIGITNCIGHSMKLGDRSAFFATDQATETPVLNARLNAARCASNHAAAIMTDLGSA
jgi:hypothetical protein